MSPAGSATGSPPAARKQEGAYEEGMLKRTEKSKNITSKGDCCVLGDILISGQHPPRSTKSHAPNKVIATRKSALQQAVDVLNEGHMTTAHRLGFFHVFSFIVFERALHSIILPIGTLFLARGLKVLPLICTTLLPLTNLSRAKARVELTVGVLERAKKEQ